MLGAHIQFLVQQHCNTLNQVVVLYNPAAVICRYKYNLNVEALGLGVSGGVTALCLTLLTAAATGGAAAQNTG